ncbi:hydrogenase maturation nickel metallochaperone HypA [Methanopyrus sp.]
MHELSVAQSVLETVLDVARKRGAERVLSVRLRIGEFTLLNPEQLRFCLEVLAEGTPVEGAKFEIEIERGYFKCVECGHKWRPEDESLKDPSLHTAFGMSELTELLDLKCPKCGSRAVELDGGDACSIESVRLEVPGEQHAQG